MQHFRFEKIGLGMSQVSRLQLAAVKSRCAAVSVRLPCRHDGVHIPVLGVPIDGL